MRRARWLGVMLTTLLAACDQLSSVGTQEEPAPQAAASALGWPYTTDAAGTTVTVRSGAEVSLSGKNSQKGADDAGVPLVLFEWQQIAGPAVSRVYRTANTISFTAPTGQPDSTELRFRLTVSDAKGASASTEARVIVRNVPDADHFLQFLDVRTTFDVEVIPTAALAPGSADVPLTVTLTKLVTFTDRDGTLRTNVPVGDPVRVDAAWAAAYGGSPACRGPTNPVVQLPLARLDTDDRLAQPGLPGFPDATVLFDVLEPSDIDAATVTFRLDVTSGAGVTPRLCVAGATTPVAPGETFDPAALVPASQRFDTRADTTAYYETIDPARARTTLDAWLQVNGFNRALPGWGADAHAVYTNDVDLGFGRDMYLKTGACDAGVTAATPIKDKVGRCDVAAVVLNHADVEAAAKKLNAFLAVAMEYSRVGTAGERFVKFYAFAPDSRTGQWPRVKSANLDARGEQYIPQSCVVCHGGVPASQPVTASYPDGGNLHSTFLPWDLDALLYSDTDPGFSTRARDAELKARLTRTAQQSALRTLNLGAYITYADSAGQPGRHALMKELLEGWYGTDLASTTFNGAFVPGGWQDGGVHGNPTGSAALYSQVFARNCRMCHTTHVPLLSEGSAATNDPRTRATCVSDPRPVKVGSQLPIACYRQFINSPSLADRVSQNEMPFARRTSDQFWVTASGTSAGQRLLDHLNATNPASPVSAPGTPVARISVDATDADFLSYIGLSADDSVGGTAYAWTVRACTGTAASPGTCTRTIPVITPAGAHARFRADDVATYRVDLALNAGTANTTAYVTIADEQPSLLTTAVTFPIGAQLPLNGRFVLSGNGDASQHRVRATISPAFAGQLQVSPAACAAAEGCPGNTPNIHVTSISGAVPSPTTLAGALNLTVWDAGSLPSSASASFNVALTASFSAPANILFADGTTSPVIFARASGGGGTTLPLLGAVQSRLPASVPGSDVRLYAVSTLGNSQQGTLDWPGAATATYTPAYAFSTHTTTGAQRAGAGLPGFTYTLERISTGERVSGTATIAVRATGTFAMARATWATSAAVGGTCAGSSCHNNNGASVTQGNLGTYTYADLRNGSLGSIADQVKVVGGPSATYAAITGSGLLCWPTNSCGLIPPRHTGLTPGGGYYNAAALDAIRRWLESGAFND